MMVISAGTRNHFALDLGLDRDDPASCLDALTDGVELRIDLGLIGDRTFVNNASFGAYAQVVQRHRAHRPRGHHRRRPAADPVGIDGESILMPTQCAAASSLRLCGYACHAPGPASPSRGQPWTGRGCASRRQPSPGAGEHTGFRCGLT
jgi:hypothetical protein